MFTKTARGALVAFTLSVAFVSGNAAADWYESLSTSVKESSVAFDFRFRNETADLATFADQARVSTLRSRLTWTSADLGPWAYGVEADYVTVVGSERYHSLSHGMTRYPVIADPEGFDLNRLFLKYAGEDLTGTLGRQRINHDRQRFVGGVAWRQNEQSMEGVRIEYGKQTKLEYAYVSRINRIFGPDDGVQPRQWDSDSHFVRGSVQLAKAHTVTGFGYFMDFENGNGVPNSNATLGVEYTGGFGPFKLAAALAHQSDVGNSPLDYSAPYYFVEAKVSIGHIGMTAGHEVLGSDDGNAGFRTPLATLHKFQGWADVFLGTPATGVKDSYLGMSAKVGKATLAVIYHAFAPYEGGADYGDEIDVVVNFHLHKALKLQLKYASYSAESFSVDTEKLWASVRLTL